MGGGGTVAAPVPTAAEQQLQMQQSQNIAQQTDILKQQWAQQQMLAPILYQQAGIKPTMDPSGKITGFEQIVDPNAEKVKSLQSQYLDMQQQALSGKLPIDPSLTNELDKQDRTLAETLRQNLGAGWETSTPGIQAMAEQGKRRGELTYSASRGDLTLAQQLGLAQQQGSDAQMQNLLGRITGVNSMQGNMASLFGNAASTAGTAIQGYQNQSALSLNAAMGNQQAKSAQSAGQMGLVGAGIGGAAMIGAAAIF